MRISRETMLMEMAHVAAKRGTCGRLAVGTVIARDARPISLGYVGPPAGEPHCWEFGCDLTQRCTRTLHAERNAIEWAWKQGLNIEGADLFNTDASCADCCSWIIDAKIARVYYDREYHASSLPMLLERGIEVYRVLANGMIRRLNAKT